MLSYCFKLYMIPEIRAGILEVDVGPLENEDEHMESDEKTDREVPLPFNIPLSLKFVLWSSFLIICQPIFPFVYILIIGTPLSSSFFIRGCFSIILFKCKRNLSVECNELLPSISPPISSSIIKLHHFSLYFDLLPFRSF